MWFLDADIRKQIKKLKEITSTEELNLDFFKI